MAAALALAAISAAGWLTMSSSMNGFDAYCGLGGGPWPQVFATQLRWLFWATPPQTLAAHWCAMILAMTPPLLWRPAQAAYAAGLGTLLGLVAGYAAVWGLVGLVMSPLAIVLRALGVSLQLQPLAFVLPVAVLWQMSSQRRRALVLCTSGAGGWLHSGGLSPLRSGVRLGMACVGVCWAWMLVPLVLHGSDRLLMAAVMLFMIIEREVQS